MKSNDQITNFKWLNTVKLIPSEQWHNEKVIRINDIDNFYFYGQSIHYEAAIDPSKIKGIEYAWAYNHNTDICWLDLLNDLKRFQYVKVNFHSLNDLIDHIHKDYNEGKSVLKYGDTLITSVGQHRLTLAKFLNIPSVKVSVVEFKFDYAKYDKFQTTIHCFNRLKILKLVDVKHEITVENYNQIFININIADQHHSLDTQVISEFTDYVETLKGYTIFHKIEFAIKSSIFPKRLYHDGINDTKDFASYSHLLRYHIARYVEI